MAPARGWVEQVCAAAVVEGLRVDAAASVVAVADVLVQAAGGGATSAPTWVALMRATDRSRRTIARALAWLRAQRLLVTVEHGSTQAFRPASMTLEGNRAAVYLFTTPHPPAAVVQAVTDAPRSSVSDRSGTPPASLPRERRRKPPHTREDALVEAPQRPASGSPPRGAAGKDAEDEERDQQAGRRGYRWCPQRGSRGAQRTGDLAVAAALRRSALDLRPVSDAAVRSVIAPFTAAGWEVADLVHAIDHDPSGAARTFTAAPTAPLCPVDVDGFRPRGRREVPARPVVSPVAWLRWRLAPWAPRAAAGGLGPAAARRETSRQAGLAARAAAAARQAEVAAAQAARTPPPSAFLAARAALADRAWKPSRLDGLRAASPVIEASSQAPRSGRADG